jgi:hypothetical protein
MGRRSRRSCGGAAGRHGSAAQELRRGLNGVAGARDRNKLHGTASYLLAQLRECSLTAKRRRRREPEGGGARVSARARHKRRQATGVSGRRSRGRRKAYKGLGMPLGVRATHGEACLARTRRRRRSPGRGRAELGDDRRAPAVSLSGWAESGAAGGCGPAELGQVGRKAALGRRRGCGLPSWVGPLRRPVGWVGI